MDVIDDVKDFLSTCRFPSCLEGGWIRFALHRRSRQWHLMYRRSRMVNNMGMVDGRVENSKLQSGSYELARDSRQRPEED